MKNKIIWSKWVDPFVINPEKPYDRKSEEDDDFISDYKPTFDGPKESDDHFPTGKLSGLGNVIVGPMGIIPLTEYSIPSKVFNFWMIHTNFDISKKIKDQIQAVPGVETLNVYTRYRARIGIGKAFDPGEVKLEIEKLFSNPEKSKKEPETPVSILKKQLSNKYKHWVILIRENGTMDTFGSDIKTTVEEKAKNSNAKNIYTSWQ